MGCDLFGRVVSLGMGVEVLKAHTMSTLFLPHASGADVSSQLLSLPACCLLSTMMVMDSL